MVTTRSSQEAKPSNSSQEKASPETAGSKRKSPAPKREQKGTKKQKTLEETVNGGGAEKEDQGPEAMQEDDKIEDTKKQKTIEETVNGGGAEKEEQKPEAMHEEDKVEGTGDVSLADDGPKAETEEKQAEETESDDKKPEAEESHANGTAAVEESSKREETTPSNILEKGIIYFFFRSRVGIDDPSNVNDIARSYMVLRPLPHGAKLGDGPIGDAGNSRLLALPKKVFPTSHKDRFMVFVEKSGTSFKDLKDNFIASTDYETKTAGTRHSPAATPAGEGVYAITSTGRESHLAYILTIPTDLGKVQKDLGLHERGSFITSVRNPQYEAPANTGLPKGPEYPQDILDEFRSLRWIPLQAKHLNYANTQVLLIGEGRGEIGKATEQQEEDAEQGKPEPVEEIEKLEEEDEERINGLKGDESEAVFADLGLSEKEYPKVQTTW